MWGAVDRLSGVLLDAAVAAAVLSSVVALTMVASRQPARRRALARAGLCGSLALWPLVVLGPVARFEPLQEMGRLIPARAWLRPDVASDENRAQEVGQPAETARVHLARLLTLSYAVGAAFGLASFVLGWCGTNWLTARSRPASPTVHGLYIELPFEGFGSRPRLRVATRIRRPVLAGWLRPTILIPDNMDTAPATEALRLGLLHELAHAEQLDATFGAIGTLAQAVWFFLPPIWWIRGQMRLDQEFLADHQASSGFAHSTAYASSLVELASDRPVQVGAGVGAGVAGASPATGTVSALFLRVLMLVRRPFPLELSAPLWWRGLCALAVACGTLAASTLSLRGNVFAIFPCPPRLGPVPEHGRFQLSLLVVDPEDPGRARQPGGRPLVLPPVLPAQFELTFDVWAGAAELRDILVIGHRLFPSAEIRTGWHTIRARRDGAAMLFELDGRPLSTRPQSQLPRRLTLHVAPDLSIKFRNLTLVW
jgi:beta-lactamase regulating signal transducer with metallopeptidase domain